VKKVERKTCLITGASGGIGLQIAKQVIDDGWQVVLHYCRNFEAIQLLMNESREDTILQVIQADLTKKEGIETLLQNLHFSIDAFIHASGHAYKEMLQFTPIEVMDEMVMHHVQAPWILSKHLLPDMIKRQQGKIVMISSIWGEVGASHEVIYSSVKGAQNSFVKALSKEVGRSGIQVNAISPGFINTKMNKNYDQLELQALMEEIPAGKAGDPKDVADLALFLLSQKSNYINGQILSVNGGWY
jgi:3-oxoacyl-[acyl-carrier protein] reductase